MKRMSAFSLVEMLICVAIILLILALSAPALTSAKDSAKRKSSQLRLRQLYSSTVLYLNDYPDASSPNDRPPLSYVYSTFLGLGEPFFISPCGIKPTVGPPPHTPKWGYAYWAIPNPPDPYYQKYGDNSMLFSDPNCNAHGVFDSPYATKRGLGVTMGGRLINHVKPGNAYRESWWTTPEE